ncbi:iron-containing alcohol dehydrogenase [Enhydrobacter aerosaccus]|nr:iron-containing alcohol dehydrogenase [Enhydrobacter aerosaccus]
MDEVRYGAPAADATAELVGHYGAERVFLMVSGTLNRQTEEIDHLRHALGGRCIGTFDAMPAHSPRSAVIAAADQARQGKADLIVTLGGGSITDGAKAVQLCLSNDIRSVEALDRIRAPAPAKAPAVRQISIPTTLSAGEFSAISGITNEATKGKEMYHHPDIVPRAVVLDPRVTRHTPMWLWLSTGIRAVDHCVEGICSNEATPYGDASALHGLSMLVRGLSKVRADPSDMEARLDCQIGAWLSMTPLTAGVPMGASHGIGYVLGAVFGIPHGHTSCIMLPAVMRWNKPANAHRQAMIAAAMGHPGKDAADVLAAFIAGLGMPHRLRDVDVDHSQFDLIAQKAMATPWVLRNPRRIDGPTQVREILELAA